MLSRFAIRLGIIFSYCLGFIAAIFMGMMDGIMDYALFCQERRLWDHFKHGISISEDLEAPPSSKEASH